MSLYEISMKFLLLRTAKPVALQSPVQESSNVKAIIHVETAFDYCETMGTMKTGGHFHVCPFLNETH